MIEHTAALALIAVLAIDGTIQVLPARLLVPGTRLSIERPQGFFPSSTLPGLELPGGRAWIIVSEEPAPFAELKKAHSKERLAQVKITLLTSRRLTRPGPEALLLHVTQQSSGVSIDRWLFLGDDGARTVRVEGACPPTDQATCAAVEGAVASTTWRIRPNEPGLSD